MKRADLNRTAAMLPAVPGTIGGEVVGTVCALIADVPAARCSQPGLGLSAVDMASHLHSEPHGDALTDAAQATLERTGEQWTPMRAAVFGVLARAEQPLSAYDIAEAIGKAEDRRVAANSVYRILDLFVGSNLSHRVESENAYIVNAHPECLHDCIFLICDRCHRTAHLDDDRITGGVRRAAEAAGFSPARPVVEVRGLCADCERVG